MEDNRSKQMEVASDLAHIATREHMNLSDDEMWVEKDGELHYDETVQNLFNSYYDDFDTVVSKIFTEKKAYYLDTEHIEGGTLIPNSPDFNVELFKSEAEAVGNILSLHKLTEELNKGELSSLNLSTHFLIID